MKQISCFKCDTAFEVPNALYAQLLSSGDSFFCPHGHRQHFTQRDDTIERLELKVKNLGNSYDYLRDRRDALLGEVNFYRRSAASYKGKLKRLIAKEPS